MDNLKRYIFIFLCLFTGSGKVDTCGIFLSLQKFNENLKINVLDLSVIEDNEENMSNKIEGKVITNNFSNKFLMLINSCLIIALIILVYVIFVIQSKSRLQLSDYFDEPTIIDLKPNCVNSVLRRDKEGNILSRMDGCDENENGIIDSYYVYSKSGKLNFIEYDKNENGIIDNNISFDIHDRYKTHCSIDENLNEIESCKTFFSNGLRIENKYFYDKNSDIIEETWYINKTSKYILKIKNKESNDNVIIEKMDNE